MPQSRQHLRSLQPEQQQGTAAQKEEAKELRQEIEKQISGISGKLAEGLVVTPAEGGLLLTISDQTETPMFNVGSAVPRGEMVPPWRRSASCFRSVAAAW